MQKPLWNNGINYLEIYKLRSIMSKISIIIPIYQTGKVLRKTLHSIKIQTFKDFECLLVDDGSNDILTQKICNEFVREDNRFKYLYKQNEGIEKTRLFGVRNATTDLLIFCDHDDYYEKKAVQLLFDAYQKSGSQIIVANCFTQIVRIKTLTKRKNSLGITDEFILDQDQFRKSWFLNFSDITDFRFRLGGNFIIEVFLIKTLNFLESIY